jgi:hypothetical protein
MPSLLGTYVAANYGRMTSIDTYGGLTYNNLGTRNLAFLKISSTIISSIYGDFTLANGYDTDASNVSGINNQISTFNPAVSQTAGAVAYLDSNSQFSIAVRTIQQFAEVYLVGTPYTTGSNSGFVVAVALDTANDANSSSNTQLYNTGYPTLGGSGAWGALAAQLVTALRSTAPASSAAGAATLNGAPTVTISQIFPYGTGFVAVAGSASAT